MESGVPSDSDFVRAELTAHLVSSFAVAKIIRDHEKPVNSLDFHHSGMLLASAGSDDTLIFTEPRSGQVKNILPVKKYGCGVIRFLYNTSTPNLLTATAAKGADDAIRALDLETCAYERYYVGHSARVVGLAPSPKDPALFLSSSLDFTVSLWDARKRDPIGQISLNGRPAVAFDPKGLVFGVSYLDKGSTQVKLYDARSYGDGPFVDFVAGQSTADPTTFAFSPDGEYFVLSSSETGDLVRTYDAYEGKEMRRFRQVGNRWSTTLCASISPDAKFLMTGYEDHSMCIFDVASSRCLVDVTDMHALPVTSVAWNPVYGMLATACQNIALWLPTAEGILSGD
jgi:COMPASS component SWD2